MWSSLKLLGSWDLDDIVDNHLVSSPRKLHSTVMPLTSSRRPGELVLRSRHGRPHPSRSGSSNGTLHDYRFFNRPSEQGIGAPHQFDQPRRARWFKFEWGLWQQWTEQALLLDSEGLPASLYSTVVSCFACRAAGWCTKSDKSLFISTATHYDCCLWW